MVLHFTHVTPRYTSWLDAFQYKPTALLLLFFFHSNGCRLSCLLDCRKNFTLAIVTRPIFHLRDVVVVVSEPGFFVVDCLVCYPFPTCVHFHTRAPLSVSSALSRSIMSCLTLVTLNSYVREESGSCILLSELLRTILKSLLRLRAIF
ncbi:hypothetical protein DPMN_062671 [Dreissena polymorpha]|uniref:Uncharacterized protein n=1 Tax=Dreissena polymorpha TaxID=45954 RepID=A0A9D4C9V2_DREPO|nr:hypothetical protein DPMN_062671 [Dreissena polymorpha]